MLYLTRDLVEKLVLLRDELVDFGLVSGPLLLGLRLAEP